MLERGAAGAPMRRRPVEERRVTSGRERFRRRARAGAAAAPRVVPHGGLLRGVSELPAAVALLRSGCAPAARGGAGSGAVIHVAVASDGTVARLDATTGRPVGPALQTDPAGPRPTQVIPVAGGGLVAVSPDAAAA